MTNHEITTTILDKLKKQHTCNSFEASVLAAELEPLFKSGVITLIKQGYCDGDYIDALFVYSPTRDGRKLIKQTLLKFNPDICNTDSHREGQAVYAWWD